MESVFDNEKGRKYLLINSFLTIFVFVKYGFLQRNNIIEELYLLTISSTKYVSWGLY